MGRWGFRMFQGDRDCDIVSDIDHEFGLADEQNPQTAEEVRIKLDSGVGAKLMKHCRSEENAQFYLEKPEYVACIAAARMMQFGAKLTEEDRQYLREALAKIPGLVGYHTPLSDFGFRAHGKVQFANALERYVDGKPRNFFDDCCANCGNTSEDLDGAALKQCVQCDNKSFGMYCNKDCQRQNWKAHKLICGPRRSGSGIICLNV